MEPACGLHLGILLICLVQVEHLWATKAPRPSSVFAGLVQSSSESKPNLNQETMPLQIFGLSTALIGGGSFETHHQTTISRGTWSNTPSTGNYPLSLLDMDADIDAALLNQIPGRTATSASAFATLVSSRLGSEASNPTRLSSPTSERNGNIPSWPEAGNQHPEVPMKAGQAQQSYTPASAPHVTFIPQRHSQSTASNEASGTTSFSKQRPGSKIYRKTPWRGSNPAQGARDLPASRTSAQHFGPISIPERFGGHAIIQLKEPAEKESVIYSKPTGRAPGRQPVRQQEYVDPQRPSAPQQAYLFPQRPSVPQQIYLEPQRPLAPGKAYLFPQRPSLQIYLDPPRPSAPGQAYLFPQRPSAPGQAYLDPLRPSAPGQAYLDPLRPSAPGQAYLDPLRPLAPGKAYLDPLRPSVPQQIYLDPLRPLAPGKAYLDPLRPSVPQQIYLDPPHPVVPGQAYLPPQRPSVPQQIYLDPPHPVVPGQAYLPPQRPSVPQQAFAAPQQPSASYKPVRRVHPKAVWKRIRLGKMITS
uniref:extensin-like isoform X2 n=1 Tax=Gasterosteus aculeatus aculeatus TaxID=481459 RepID=UPI001A9877CF|nr:extensin-like isoform X2 [Gasterosteus aculeatus aculeatus]